MFNSSFLKILSKAMDLILPEGRGKFVRLTLAQVIVNLFDLAGILIIGFVGALSVSGIQSRPATGKMGSFISFMGLSSLDFQQQIAILGGIGAILLVLKSLISALLTKKILHFLSFRSAELSKKLIVSLFKSPVTFIRRRTEKETIYSVTTGVDEIALRMIGSSATVISDVSLLIFLSIGLFIIQPLVALSSTTFFLVIVLTLQKIVTKRASKLGLEVAKLTVSSVEDISTTIDSYRVLYVHNQLESKSKVIADKRLKLAYSQAEMTFMPNISKYVIEISLVIGAILLSASQFLLTDAIHSFSTLAVFLTAATRIAPAMLRAQQAAIQFRGSIGAADYTISLANELQDNSIETKIEQINQTNLKNENLPEILVSNVSFSFGENQVISDISFKIMPGKFCALVGLSGAGKSTLVDLILGIHKPESGQILIHGLPPANLVREYSNFISYVPQENNLINGTIVENLNFSYSNQQYSIDECLRTLELVGLVEWVDSLPLGLDTQIGETGVKLSGGQRQRLSIAAALLCNPKLLILDEATSALDAISEDEIKSLLDGIKGQVTCLVIAHRLSSIRDADSIFMIENGSLAGQGRFEELKKINSTFAKQAKLMGL